MQVVVASFAMKSEPDNVLRVKTKGHLCCFYGVFFMKYEWLRYSYSNLINPYIVHILILRECLVKHAACTNIEALTKELHVVFKLNFPAL